MNDEIQLMSEPLLQRNVPMARYTTWGAGGNADYLAMPANVDELQSLLCKCDQSLPITWLGLGSNVLIRDGGIRGLVILTRGLQESLQQITENCITVGAGVSCAKVSRFAAACDLGGAEFLAGIPGTMGGALAMNAGAFGASTWDIVQQVQTIHRNGELQYRAASEFQVAYRSVLLAEDTWFVSATLALHTADSAIAKSKVKSIIAARAASQPIGQRSCGSVFKNPANRFAAQLIEECGLKGFHIGGACVSEKHSNFIINRGEATAADIEQLIRHIQVQVKARFGVELEPEVRIIGETGP